MLVKTDPASDSLPAASTSTAPAAPAPPSYEEALREPANRLQAQITNYNALDQLDTNSDHEEEAQKVAAAMRDLGDQHPDPEVKRAWHERSKRFSRATRRVRREILEGVGHGPLHMLLALPCTIVGVALCVVGGALQAVSGIIGGVGGALAGGSRESRYESRYQERRHRRDERQGRRGRRNSDPAIFRR